ncbi:MAG: hypothetical protein AOA66_1194 [Candidatus Bathyarchaeota archaeon BA2]|nr:MAG: hypothetical protein AOA66_1194 [Candidatus Bathyarchaeota archaeon BA2]
MALRIKKVVEKIYVSGIEPKDASHLYVGIDADYLRAYDMGEGDVLHGKIISISPSAHAEVQIYEIEGKKIDFIYDGGYRLYISKASIPLLRECGLVKPGFVIEVEFPEASVKGKK